MNKAVVIREQNLYIFLSSESAKTGKLVIIASKGNGKVSVQVQNTFTLYLCLLLQF